MTPENWLLSAMSGLVIGWIANAMSKSRYSFPINLIVGFFGAILLNIVVTAMEILNDHFIVVLTVSAIGATILLTLFHLSRLSERSRRPKSPL